MSQDDIDSLMKEIQDLQREINTASESEPPVAEVKNATVEPAAPVAQAAPLVQAPPSVQAPPISTPAPVQANSTAFQVPPTLGIPPTPSKVAVSVSASTPTSTAASVAPAEKQMDIDELMNSISALSTESKTASAVAPPQIATPVVEDDPFAEAERAVSMVAADVTQTVDPFSEQAENAEDGIAEVVSEIQSVSTATPVHSNSAPISAVEPVQSVLAAPVLQSVQTATISSSVQAAPVLQAVQTPSEQFSAQMSAQENEDGISSFRTNQSSAGEGLDDTLGSVRTDELESAVGHSPLNTQYTEEEVESGDDDSNVVQMPASKRARSTGGQNRTSGRSEKGNGRLSMALQGTMELELAYESDGESVNLFFEEGFLVVELSNGTEFRVPLTAESKGSRRRENRLLGT